MEVAGRKLLRAAETAGSLIESTLALVTRTDAVRWCAFLVAEREPHVRWRVVHGDGPGAPQVGTVWSPEELDRAAAGIAPWHDGGDLAPGSLFFRPVSLPAPNGDVEGQQGIVFAQAHEAEGHSPIHDTLHTLFDHLHALFEHLPGTHSEPVVDHTTGLLTERALLARLDVEVARAERYGGSLSVLLYDVDEVRGQVDALRVLTEGNVVDDLAMRAIGGALRSSLRQMDCAGRYGPDGVLVLLPETGAEESLSAGARLGQQIGQAIERSAAGAREAAGSAGALFGDEEPAYELRLGAATFPTSAKTAETLVAQAAEALRRARAPGSAQWARHALDHLNVPPASGYRCVCRRCGRIFEVDDRAHQRARRFCSHACYIEARRESERERDDAIRALRESGLSLRQIAQRFSISPERVRQICLSPD